MGFSLQVGWNACAAVPQGSRSQASVLLGHSSTSSNTWTPVDFRVSESLYVPEISRENTEAKLARATSIPSPVKQAMELTLLSNILRFPRALLWNIKSKFNCKRTKALRKRVLKKSTHTCQNLYLLYKNVKDSNRGWSDAAQNIVLKDS